MSVVGNLDFSLSRRSLEYLVDMRRDPIDQLPHINLRLFASDFTSFCLVLRKDGDSTFSKEALDQRRRYIDSFAAIAQTISHSPAFQKRDPLHKRLIKVITRKTFSIYMRLKELVSIETWVLASERKKAAPR